MKSNRILFLDYSRVFAAFLVVFAHLYSSDSNIRLFIYAFYMPFFFLVSGILHKEVSDYAIFIKSIKSILIPAFFYISVGALVVCCVDNNNVLTIALTSMYSFYRGESMAANSIVWFLFSLFFVKILSNSFIHHGYNMKIVILLLFLVFIVKSQWFSFFYFDTSCMALPFYLIGYYSKANLISVSKENWKWYIGVFLFLLITICLTLINGRVSMYGCGFGIRRWPVNVFLFYLNGLIGSMLLLCLSLMFKKRLKVCEIVAGCLISIVGFQEIFIRFYIDLWGQDQPMLISLFFSLVIMASCCILHIIVMRFFPQAVGK